MVPRVLGGTRTIPLCNKCHAQVHGMKAVNLSRLVKEGQRKAREAGKRIGVPPKYDASFVDKTITLLSQYKNISKVAALLGINESSIRYILRRSKNEIS